MNTHDKKKTYMNEWMRECNNESIHEWMDECNNKCIKKNT